MQLIAKHNLQPPIAWLHEGGYHPIPSAGAPARLRAEHRSRVQLGVGGWRDPRAETHPLSRNERRAVRLPCRQNRIARAE